MFIVRKYWIYFAFTHLFSFLLTSGVGRYTGQRKMNSAFSKMQMRYNPGFSILSIFSSLCRASRKNSVGYWHLELLKNFNLAQLMTYNACIFLVSNVNIYDFRDSMIIQLWFMGLGSPMHGSWCFEEISWKCRAIYRCTLGNSI